MRGLKKLFLVVVLVVGILANPIYAMQSETLNQGFSQLEMMIDMIRGNYYKDVSDEEILEALYKGLFNALDKNSVYFTPEEYEQFNSSLDGNFSGVGISIGPKDGYIEVIAPIKGTPADRAGIRAGDLIVAVDGKDIKGMATDMVVSMIRGPIGQSVRLTIKRENPTSTFEIALVREMIEVISVSHKLVEGIDVIEISSFDYNTTRQLQQILSTKTFSKGVIIDLRNNPGGLLDQAVAVSDLFLPRGVKIVTLDYPKAADTVYNSLSEGLKVPMVVLINGGSASASEIFAAAMQENKRAVIIGTQSYGKGTVQGTIALPDSGAMKLTIASYLTPSGKDIHGIGVTPDLVVENATEFDSVASKFIPLTGLATVSRGSKSMEVMGMQQHLNYLGYKLSVDGSFGPMSESALKEFQKAVNIPVTGVLNVATKLSLMESVKVKASSAENDQQMAEAVKKLN